MMYPTLLALVFPLVSIAAMAAAQSQTATLTLPTLVLPSPTSIGNASNILTYPLCAQYCANNTYPGCNPPSIDCVCGPLYRSQSAACEELVCSQVDLDTTANLAQQLCGPLYANNSTLSSSVAAAIASATSVAAAAVSSKDVANPTSYPQCSQDCFNQVTYLNCGSLSNRTCICTSVPFNEAAAACEIANCSQSDLNIVLDLVGVLCESVFNITNGTTTAVSPTTTTAVSPTITPFKGAATSVVSTGFSVFCVAFMGLVGFAVLL